MSWSIIIDPSVRKALRHIPKNDAKRVSLLFKELAVNPHSGDIDKMEGEDDVWRRRIGSYRIFYEIHKNKKIIYIFKLKRRTSTTY
jgi:mRNA interferase RelE/StbE